MTTPLLINPPDERVPLLGTRRPSSPSSVGSHSTQNSFQAFLDPETRNPARRVRVNALRTTLGETTWSAQSNSKSSLFVTTVLLPQVLAATYLLPKYWKDEECVNSSSPIALREWILGDAVVKFFQILLTWTPFILVAVRANRATAYRVLRFQRTTSFVVDVFSVVWVVQGTNLFLTPNAEDGCHAPHLFPLGQFNFALSLFFFTLPVLICLMFVPLVCCCFPCFVRFLLAVRANDAPIVGATANELDTLPVKQYDPISFQGSNDDKTPQCAICLSQYAEGEQIRELPCDSRHHFHRACVDDWLRLNATCPVCRSRMFQRNPPAGQGAPRTTVVPLRNDSDEEDEPNVESRVLAVGENVADAESRNVAPVRNADDSLV